MVALHNEGNILSGVYAVGWIRRGPIGLIGHDKQDGTGIVKSIQEDLENLTPCQNPSSLIISQMIERRRIQAISFDNCKKLILRK